MQKTFFVLPLLLAAAACGQDAAKPAGDVGDTAPLMDSESGPITLRANTNFCVDVKDAQTTNNTPIQLFTCLGEDPKVPPPAQKWQFAQGSLKALGKCLTATQGLQNGSPVFLSDCTGAAEQRWNANPEPDYRIQLVGQNKCLDLPAGGIGNFKALQLYDCADPKSDSAINQQWLKLATTTPGSNIVSRADKKLCLDLRDGIAKDGTPVQLWPCNKFPAQQWSEYPDGSLRVAGLCLDAPANNRKPGDKLQAYGCVAGLPNQQWEIDKKTSLIRLIGSNLCVDITGGKPEKGNVLQLWECDQANKYQIWDFK